jgi:type IV pilus assembly protein PilC
VERAASVTAPPSSQTAIQVNVHEVLRFARQFSVKLKAGLSPEKCLEVLSHEMRDRGMRAVCHAMRAQVSRGSPLALAMREHPGAFDEGVIRLVSAGEQGGNLRGALAAAADYLERIRTARAGLHSAVAQPLNVLALVLLAVFIATVVLSFLAADVLPSSLAHHHLVGQSVLDRITIQVSEVIRWVWPFVGVFGACCFVALHTLPRIAASRTALERLAEHLPLIRNAWHATGLACFARTVTVQMRAGALLGEAMGVAAQTAPSVTFREAIAGTVDRIEAGRPYLEALVEEGFLRRRDINAAQAAERRGDLAGFMQTVAEDYERQASEAVGKLKTFSHTAVVAALGVTIVGVVLTLYVPVFFAH